jgi:Glutamine amidotransferase domain
MSNFVAFFPSSDCPQAPRSFSELNRIFRGPLQAGHVQTEVLNGAAILCERSFNRAPRFHAQGDGAGWIVLKGEIFDVRSRAPIVDLEELLHRFLAEDLADLNRYEGTFALAVWDARKQQGWAVNDQTSMLNLYYGEYDGGLYVSTNAISLARALGLGLDPYGVQELLARNYAGVIAPTTMFAGLRRVDIGEHVRYRAGTLSRARHWHWYEPEASYGSIREAADTAAAVVVDRVARYATSASSVLCDLTGGLDSRLVASAACAAGLRFAVTVNGPPDHQDVRIAHRVAEIMQWDMRHFNTSLLWTTEITPDMRRELLYRTNGELPFTEVYHHLLTRAQLAQDFGLSMQGSGGPLFRYFPWGQEFFGIGRRRSANADNVLKYRLLPHPPPPSLFSQEWLPALRSRLKSRVEEICREQPGTRTTQQLDAVHLLKETGHSSLYMSAMYDWLPSVSPLLSAGVVKAGITMPWKMRLTSRLQRQMIYTMSPRAAAIATVYGATAEPTSFKNVHLAAWQSAKRGVHLVKKLDRIWLKRINKHRSSGRSVEKRQMPFLTYELRQFLAPKTMLSRALYDAESLHAVLDGGDEDWQAHAPLIQKLATVEGLCREVGFEPEANFLASAPPK